MKRLLPLIALFFLTGCTHNTVRVTSPRMVQHVVIVWLKEPGNTAVMQQLMDASKQLSQIPGVIDIKSGAKIASERPVVDSTYDLALIITFKDEAALRAYDIHPIHKQLVTETIRPQVAKLLIYDSSIDSVSINP